MIRSDRERKYGPLLSMGLSEEEMDEMLEALHADAPTKARLAEVTQPIEVEVPDA